MFREFVADMLRKVRPWREDCKETAAWKLPAYRKCWEGVGSAVIKPRIETKLSKKFIKNGTQKSSLITWNDSSMGTKTQETIVNHLLKRAEITTFGNHHLRIDCFFQVTTWYFGLFKRKTLETATENHWSIHLWIYPRNMYSWVADLDFQMEGEGHLLVESCPSQSFDWWLLYHWRFIYMSLCVGWIKCYWKLTCDRHMHTYICIYIWIQQMFHYEKDMVCKRQEACLLSVFLKICFNLNLLGLL